MDAGNDKEGFVKSGAGRMGPHVAGTPGCSGAPGNAAWRGTSASLGVALARRRPHRSVRLWLT